MLFEFLDEYLYSFPKQHMFTWGLLISFCSQIGMLPPDSGMLALGLTVYFHLLLFKGASTNTGQLTKTVFL